MHMYAVVGFISIVPARLYPYKGRSRPYIDSAVTAATAGADVPLYFANNGTMNQNWY